MAKYMEIRTPRGRIYVDENAKAVLEWATDFQQKWMKQYSEAQKHIDGAVLDLCEPFIPKKTGMLFKSGELGTDIGSGMVKWIAPYAKAQYYMVRKNPSQTGPLRGPYWFARMKEMFGHSIIADAKRIAGGGK
ncbi:MAG: hypothetical protein JW908_04375 [Anaerolineales bacterium]|nr:hypothetical protein [Anaerolineales bacterium]